MMLYEFIRAREISGKKFKNAPKDFNLKKPSWCGAEGFLVLIG